jgi:hypothetical protein
MSKTPQCIKNHLTHDIERRSLVVNTPASYSVGPGFKSWPGGNG